MFHIYFGAFDIVLYLGGTYFALVLANAICDDRPRLQATQEVTTTTPDAVASIQSATSRPVVPVPKREEVPVRVSVSG
ncbi:MAG: hypothetical protein AAGE59_07570 [Cyanobacteria bacterium P01_F01_bin.86]